VPPCGRIQELGREAARIISPRAVRPGIEVDDAGDPLIAECGVECDVGARAQAGQDEALRTAHLAEMVERLARLDRSTLLERERVAPRLAVADSREVEPQPKEPHLGEPPREPDVETAG